MYHRDRKLGKYADPANQKKSLLEVCGKMFREAAILGQRDNFGKFSRLHTSNFNKHNINLLALYLVNTKLRQGGIKCYQNHECLSMFRGMANM